MVTPYYIFFKRIKLFWNIKKFICSTLYILEYIVLNMIEMALIDGRGA